MLVVSSVVEIGSAIVVGSSVASLNVKVASCFSSLLSSVLASGFATAFLLNKAFFVALSTEPVTVISL